MDDGAQLTRRSLASRGSGKRHYDGWFRRSDGLHRRDPIAVGCDEDETSDIFVHRISIHSECNLHVSLFLFVFAPSYLFEV